MVSSSANEPLEETAVCLEDMARLARGKLTRETWDFVAGGSGAEATVAANRAGFARVHVVPRALRDVSRCASATELLGAEVSMPLVVAPMAYQRLVHPQGELAAARAAEQAGVPFVAPMLSSYPLEEIAAVGRTWLQLYWLRDRSRFTELVRRAEDAGCEALLLTVDVPWMGRRLRDVRNRFALPVGVTAANFAAEADSVAHQRGAGTSALATHTDLTFDPSLTWADLVELRDRTRLPLIVKGILHPDDAVRAADCGVDAVVVSNHGGRQLDGAVASIDMLSAVCQVVGDRCEVLLDSGVRSGVDILKALAMGASGVFVGRPVLWGLAVAGEAGVNHVLHLLSTELKDALGLAGCASITEATGLELVSRTVRSGR